MTTSKNMVLSIISDSTFIGFVEDKAAFEHHSKECFRMFDNKEDGVITRNEFNQGFHKLMALECDFRPKQDIENLCEQVFERFDVDKVGKISEKEFQCLMKEMLLAMARGVGNSQVLVVAHPNSFMMKIVQHENCKN